MRGAGRVEGGPFTLERGFGGGVAVLEVVEEVEARRRSAGWDCKEMEEDRNRSCCTKRP
jgi:hypothetical protein